MPVFRRALAVFASAALTAPLLFAASASAATKVAAISPGLTQVNLLNINDFHGRLDGGNLDGLLGKQVACTIETAKQGLGDDKTVLLSAGDSVGASTFVSFIAQDEPTIAYLNALELKASAVGNHEFDTGFGDLTTRIQPLADWAYLGANVYQRGTTTPALPEYKVVTVNGVRVGVIGAVTQQTPSMVSPLGVSGLDFGDPVAAVNRVANQLTDGNDANGEADLLVAEYHEGPNGSSSLTAEVAASPTFADIVNRTSPKVQVIFNGHTHQRYTWDGDTTSGTRSVSQSASYGAFVGQIQLGFDPATKQVTEYVATNVATSGANLPHCIGDPQYDAAAAIVDAAVGKAKILGAVPVGKVSADITRAWLGGSFTTGFYTGTITSKDDRQRESALGNLEAQAWLDAMNVPSRPGADLGLQNPGGVRADLLYKQSGTEGDGVVTYAEAASVNPFANTLGVLTVSGAQFKEVLEQQWQPAGASRAFLNLGLSKNVRYTFDETRPKGDRVTGVWINDRGVDPAASYRIATNSFLAGGGDNFGALIATPPNFVDSGVIDMDQFISWLGKAGTISPDFTKLGVEVVNPPTVLRYGKTNTFTVQGWDMTSNLAPHNRTATLSFVGGAATQKVTIADLHVDGVPTRDGVATVTFRLTGAFLPASNKGTQYLQLASDQTGTTVTIPVIIKR